MFRKNSVFVISGIYLGNWSTHSSVYYKIYDVNSNKSTVVGKDELFKKRNSIFNINIDRPWEDEKERFTSNTISIDSYEDEKEKFVAEFAKNKRPDVPKDTEYYYREKALSEVYTLVKRGEDYVIGVNTRLKKKIFSIDDILSMSDTELKKVINIATNHIVADRIDYKEEIRDYIACLDNKGDYKFKGVGENEKNLSRTVMGTDYLIRNTGEIIITKDRGYVSIDIKKHNYKDLQVSGDYDDIGRIESFKVYSGPTKLCEIDSIGNNIHNVQIVLPNTLERIAPRALRFGHMQELDLTRCTKLKVIGSNAFYASYLKGLKIPDTVEKLGGGVVQNCTMLKWFICPKNFPYFNATWIQGCKSLETIVLPEGEMDEYKGNFNSFAMCIELKEIYTSECNVAIAQEIVKEVKKIRNILAKRGTLANKEYPEIKIVVVKRTD